MSIFREMYLSRQFDTYEAYEDLRRMLGEAIDRGYVEEVTVMDKHPMRSVENWYREKESGEIYRLVPPDFPARGAWEKVDVEDLTRSEHRVQ